MFYQVFGPAVLAGGIFFTVVSGLAGGIFFTVVSGLACTGLVVDAGGKPVVSGLACTGLVVDAGGKPVGFPAVWSVTR